MQASPSIEEGIRDSYVFAVTALVSLQNRSPLSFLDTTLGSLSQAVQPPGATESGPTKTTGFVKTTQSGAAKVSFSTTANGCRSARKRNRLAFPVEPYGFMPAVWPPVRCVNCDWSFFVTMTLRIDKTASGDKTVIHLSGKLLREVLDLVARQIASTVGEVSLDLTQLDSISLEGVRFLNHCDDRGIAITNAPAYVLRWMKRERTTTNESLC